MLFDTDVLIWVQRGNTNAANWVDKTTERLISVQTYMELLQSAQNRLQQDTIKQFLTDFDFSILPLTENIGHRATIYVEEYALSAGLKAADAIIAATATENHLELFTGNHKHFKVIKDLKVKVFRA